VSEVKMSFFKRSSLATLLIIIFGLTAIGQLSERVSATLGDSVQMSPGAYAHTLGESADVVKLDYPKSSIIQNTTGDISLNFTLSGERSSIAIYIPPEFSFLQPDTTSVWTSVTNDYKYISIRKLSSTDPIAPSWWRVKIANSTIPRGSHAVRMFNIKAPEVCGRYFLKVFIDGKSIGFENFPTVVVKGGLDPAYISGRVLNGGAEYYGLPVNVSGKVIAEGTSAFGRAVRAQAYFNASANGAYTLYGLAPGTYSLTASAAGFTPTTMEKSVTVCAGQSLEGVDIYVHPSSTISGNISSKCGLKLVPWGYMYNSSIGQICRPISIEIFASTGVRKALLTGETNPLLTYYHFSFNGSVELDGHVPEDYADYVSGLEPGDYYLKASVNGYVQKDLTVVHVSNYLASLLVSFDLQRSGWFEVTVHFKSFQGGSSTPILKSGLLTLGAYELDGTLRGSNSTIVPEGSLNCTIAVTGQFLSGTYIIKASFPGYVQLTLPKATIGEGCSATRLSFDMIKAGTLEVTLRSVDWQTPPQEVPWGYPNATIRLELISSRGDIYLTTAKQQADKTVTVANVTGLLTDTYLVRAYTFGYIQTRYYAISVLLGGISSMTIDLVKGAKIQMTLIFKKQGIIAPIDTYRYNRTHVPVRIEVYNPLGILAGANATYISSEPASTVEVIGFRSYAGNPCLRWVNYYDTTDGSLQRDYGLPADTYLVRVWVPGYIQIDTVIVSALLTGTASATLSLNRLALVSGNVYGSNMFGEPIPLSWAVVSAYGPSLVTTSSLDGFYEMWLKNGTYQVAASLPGYKAQAIEVCASIASETCVDFALKPLGASIPELSAAEPTLLAALVTAHKLLHRKKLLGKK
jgi:hypothetical protein